MLNPASWLAQAQALTQGQRERVPHDCGDGRTLLIEHKNDGWGAWCWRCSDSGWQPHPRPSLVERIDRLRAVEAAEASVQASTAPPTPAEFDPSLWPLPARVWLYKAGFSNDAIQRTLGAYYCARIARVVLPVVAGDARAYWQARGFDADRPKYLNPRIDKPLAFYGEQGTLVVTEDILSAARVGEAHRGVSIMGTSLSERHAVTIAAQAHGPILIWLDPDAAGRKAAPRLRKLLTQLGAQVHIIQSERDPKCYCRAEIEEFIQLALRLPSCAY